MFNDIKYSSRLLLKSPGFAIVVVLSLAIGMAVNTAVFSLLDAFIFRQLPIPNTDGLVFLFNATPSQPYGGSSYPRYRVYADQNTVFSGLMAYTPRSLALTTNDGTEEINGEIVSANYFSVLEVNPMMGRIFFDQEDRPLNPQPVAVLSHEFWKRRFGSDPQVVGDTVILNGHSCTIVGIANSEFTGTGGPLGTDIWVPASVWATTVREPERITDWGHSWIDVVGRLKPGVSREQAEAAMTAIAGRVAPQVEGDQSRELRVTLAPVTEGHPRAQSEMLSVALPAATMGFVVGGLVLLIGCANAANLLIARSASRRKEIAIRLALGSSRFRLVRLLLMESMLLALLAGAAGLLLAMWGIDLLLNTRPPIPIPSFSIDLSPDFRVFGFTLLLALATGILFGLTPALQASRASLITALKDQRMSIGRGSVRFSLRNILVVSQVAMSLLLLITAGLFARSLQNARGIDPGFDANNVYTLSLASDQLGMNIPKLESFDERLLERARSLPGIESASLVDPVPLSFGSKFAFFQIEGSDNPNGERIGHTHVAPGYFSTLRIALVRGRDFDDRDSRSAPKVAIINETMAERFWPNQDPIGRRVSNKAEQIEIVGVAKNTKNRDLGEETQPWLYIPIIQNTTSNKVRSTLLVRSESGLAEVASILRAELRGLDPNWPVFEFQSLSESTSIQFFLPGVAAAILGGLGLLGLLLALVGIYGVVSYSVTQRTQEIGIRMALGATSANVLRLIVSHSIALTLVGVAVGGAIAVGVTRFLTSLLFGISPTDPITFVVVSVALLGAAAAASIIPARRATRVDPIEALRCE